MDGSIPIIYRGVAHGQPRSIGARVLAAAIACACLIVLVVAARLTPSHSGFGTHQALGLDACPFLERTGLPCPGCGLTTSFAWFARGNIAASLYVQPLGTVLAFLSTVMTWAGFYIAITGRRIDRLLELLPARWVYWPLLWIALAAWGWKILIHQTGHDGW